jgi:two-component system chemotaxis response regulator CheB
MRQSIRVLVVDDSAFFRNRITQALQETGEIEVVGQGADGRQAVELAGRLHPDLITMDVEMPVMDGISAVRQIMQRRPTDIIMFSSLTREGAKATLDALDAGAVDFISKHSDPGLDRGRSSSAILRERVLAVASRRSWRQPTSYQPVSDASPRAVSHNRTTMHDAVQLVVIGASTGGPVALQRVITSLPRDFSLPVLVAVHMPAAFTPTFAERLHKQCCLEVAEARDQDPLRPGRVLLAPGGMQTQVAGRIGELWVSVKESGDQLYKPSVDLCFESAARVIGQSTLAIVLTGMGADGKQGAQKLKQLGGQVWSQNAESCVVFGMPQAVESAGLSDRVLSLEALGPALAEIKPGGSA